MDPLVGYLLRRFVRRGAMTFVTANGNEIARGDGAGPHLRVRIKNRAALWRALANPELAIGELYMEGDMVIEGGSIADALAVLMAQPGILPEWVKPLSFVRYLARHSRQFNPRGRAKLSVARHYDLDARLYSLFLDADRQYSCAYFETSDATLDDAQLAKRRHIAAKLQARQGDRLLDIGSGWGGMGCTWLK
jgi:cyclopropane-fatty-acyl-phospholipid synthase